MALTIFRRHLKKCPQRDRYFRRCNCPIHIEGTLGTEEVRRGLNLTSWEAAQNLIAEWNRAGKVGGDRVEPVTVKEAVELYLADVAARVRPSTVRLHRVLLKDSLLPWCESEGLKIMNRLDARHDPLPRELGLRAAHGAQEIRAASLLLPVLHRGEVGHGESDGRPGFMPATLFDAETSLKKSGFPSFMW